MKKQWAFDVELWGTSASDIYGGFGIHYGLGKGFEVGVNLLHLGAGVFNLSTKWNFLDLPQFALGLRFSPMFAHGDWVWIARSSTLVSGLNIWLFPVSLQLSAPILPWLQFDLSTDYVDSLVLGDVDEDSLLLDGTIALRQLAFQPVIRWHLLQRTSFYFQAKLPVITRIPGAISTEAPLVEGVLLGGEAAGRSSIPLKDTYVLTCGARSMIREDIFLDFSVNVGALAKKIYGNPISPRLQLEMRF
ncbi:MAG: hypothetical protein MK135_01970 [Polyangiaceae bacterium]|nr:hypothetical protein [Polyangiaceae bacterium]